MCEKIHALVEAVDFQHAKHNFFSAFLKVQDEVKDGLKKVIRRKEPLSKRISKRFKKLFPKRKSHIGKILKNTKKCALEILHMDEIIEATIEKVHRKRVLVKKMKEVGEDLSEGIKTNITEPIKEVCTTPFLGRMWHSLKKNVWVTWYRLKTGVYRSSRPALSALRVFGIFAIIFSATFVILNLEAIGTVATHYVKTDSMFSGYFEAKEAAEEYVEVESLAPAPEMLVLAEEERERVQAEELLPLNLDVTPDDNRIIIPRINKNIPITDVSDETVIYSERLQDIEDSLQDALKGGVVRYPGTAVPGEQGNVFLTGHSSYYLLAPGDYKDVFALLHKMELGDEVIVYYNQKKVRYKVNEIKEVWPNEVEILEQTNDYRLTLMTCTPIGTNLRRLVVTAIQVQ